METDFRGGSNEKKGVYSNRRAGADCLAYPGRAAGKGWESRRTLVLLASCSPGLMLY
jgi:hypothetical protein